MRVYSVTEFRDELNELLGQAAVSIQGEVSGFHVSQNRFVWFSLTDGKCTIDCFMLKFQLDVALEDGMQIQAIGVSNLFQKGKLAFRPRRIELVGAGAVRQAFEALKKQLEAEGLFDPSRKRSVPQFPQRIALVTSKDAAAYTDVLRILKNRWPLVEIVHVPVQVQGAQAPKSIVSALQQLNTVTDIECIVLTRGGGSAEDLDAFNDEAVVRAVFGSRHPVIAGVGHERDVTLTDLVADVRAATPSNAAELLTPYITDVRLAVAGFRQRLLAHIDRQLSDHHTQLTHLLHSLDRAANMHVTRVQLLTQRLHAAFDRVQLQVTTSQQRLMQLRQLLQSYHPDAPLERGYTMTLDATGKPLTTAIAARTSGVITTRFKDGQVTSEVI